MIRGVDKGVILMSKMRIMRSKGVDMSKHKLVRGRAETGTVLP